MSHFPLSASHRIELREMSSSQPARRASLPPLELRIPHPPGLEPGAPDASECPPNPLGGLISPGSSSASPIPPASSPAAKLDRPWAGRRDRGGAVMVLGYGAAWPG